jgi:hypothetical protein
LKSCNELLLLQLFLCWFSGVVVFIIALLAPIEISAPITELLTIGVSDGTANAGGIIGSISMMIF